jgi:glycosyltransferase involved in cell wall biosynthesis
MRICLINNIQASGSSFYRLELPHAHLDNNYKGINFYITNDANKIVEKDFAHFDIVVASRMWGYTDSERIRLRDMCTKYGVKLVLDLDDYWVLESGHPFYSNYRENKMPDRIREHIKIVDHVICTNEVLLQKIKPLNPNVTIIPNCPYRWYEQYRRNPTQSDMVRFGWFGGAQHYEDIILMSQGLEVLADDKPLDNRYRLFLGGWNENDMYYAYQQVFSAKGKSNNYGTIAAADIYSYIGGYNFVDVCLAPLRDTTFNRCKSELKLVEAGAMNKAIICSDVYPYNTVIKHGVNGLLVKESRPRDWYKMIKKLINEPELRKTLADNLTKTIDADFNIDTWGAVRYELYKSLL